MNVDLQALAMECNAVAYAPPPYRAVRGVSMTFDQVEAFAKRIANPLVVEITGNEATILHLSVRVDQLSRLLNRSMSVMRALHQSAEPDESTEGLPAVIQPAAFCTFVDAHADLLFQVNQLGLCLPDTQPSAAETEGAEAPQ